MRFYESQYRKKTGLIDFPQSLATCKKKSNHIYGKELSHFLAHKMYENELPLVAYSVFASEYIGRKKLI